MGCPGIYSDGGEVGACDAYMNSKRIKRGEKDERKNESLAIK